jgi:phosphoribosyl-ATP pyrophosphohydrolase
MDTIKKLYDVLLQRKSADASSSYVASLYAKGTGKIVNKIIEESVETGVEAFKGDTQKLAAESADLLFHLMVLWAHHGVTPDDVMNILDTRAGTSGHAEKSAREK